MYLLSEMSFIVQKRAANRQGMFNGCMKSAHVRNNLVHCRMKQPKLYNFSVILRFIGTKFEH